MKHCFLCWAARGFAGGSGERSACAMPCGTTHPKLPATTTSTTCFTVTLSAKLEPCARARGDVGVGTREVEIGSQPTRGTSSQRKMPGAG
eukprot:3936277-Rhodomonas_salina.1